MIGIICKIFSDCDFPRKNVQCWYNQIHNFAVDGVNDFISFVWIFSSITFSQLEYKYYIIVFRLLFEYLFLNHMYILYI